MKVTIVLKHHDETWSYTNAELNVGNGVVQVRWAGESGRRQSRAWPTGDVRYYETEEERAP